jgi:hypothetical protein
MHCFKAVSFCFHLLFISAAVLVAVASISDECKDNRRSFNKPDIRSLESMGYCHYKVCEEKYGNQNGRTRNPDVIYKIVCDKTANCTQVYLTVELSFYNNGSLHKTKNETLPLGCVYSVADLRNSITLTETPPNPVT